MDTAQTENLPPSQRRSSKLRTLIKWGIILGSVCVILLIVLSLLLTYFFPSDFVRKELETQGSELLQGTVRIDSLAFNLLTGLELKKVDFSQQDRQILQFARLNLDYSILELLRGKLQINEIVIEQADASLNLPEIAAAQTTEEARPPLAEEPTVIPPIPVSINLQSLAIRDSNIDLIVTSTLAVELKAFTIDISGKVNEYEAALDGHLQVENINLNLEDKQIHLPLAMSFSMTSNLSDQQLIVQELMIQSEPHLHMNLSGEVNKFFGDPDLNLALEDTRFDLKSLFTLVQDFLPPDVGNMTIAGTLSPTVTITGRMDDLGFQGTIQATVNAQKLMAKTPQLEAQTTGTDLSLVISDMSIKDNTPVFGNVQLDLSNQHSQFGPYLVQDLTVSAATEYFAAGPVSGQIKTSGISSIPATSKFPSLTLPFTIQLNAQGNYKTQDVTVQNVGIALTDLITIQAQGEFHPQASQPSKVSLKARIAPQLNNILSLVPKSLLEGINLHKEDGPDVITLNVTGGLKKDYMPQWIKASSRISLSNLTTGLEALPAQGTIEKMNVLLSTGYNATSGQIGGTVGVAIQASDLQQHDSMTVGKTDLKLKSTFLGHTTSSWEVTDLRSQETLSADIGEISVTHPSLEAKIDQVTISAKTKEDPLKRDFVIEHLGVTSDQLVDFSMKGRYRMNTQEFSIKADMPFMKVGNILTRLSGELVQPVNEMNPSGTISLSLQASGHLPEPSDIETFALPITANMSVTLQDVDGAFAEHQIHGANGTLGVSLTPGDHPVVKIASDLRMNDIQLPPELPLSHVPKALTSFNVSIEDFNDIHLKEVHLGMQGADLVLQGNITGVKEIIQGSFDVGILLERLFAQIQTKASFHFSEFQDLLKQFDMKGSGRSQLDMSFSKKEKGPLHVKLTLDTKDMSMTQGTTTVTNLNGKLALQKQLEWKDNIDKPSSRASFNPTNVLSRLRSVTGKQKSLKIDHIDLGWLSLSNFSTHILFDGLSFKIQNLAMNLLGGGLGGDVVVTTGKAFGTSARIEAARLDLNQLLADDLKISGDSLIDATVGLSMFFEEETHTLDLSRTEVQLFITHIGQEAVDRLLVFLDPEGSNPTLVSARSQVRLANPSQVTIKIVRGMLSLEIRFSEGLLPPFKMNRIPIGRLKNLRNVTEAIPEWETVAAMMAMAGAQTYGMNADREIVIQ